MTQPDTFDLTLKTIRIGVESTVIAAAAGIPLGVVVGLGRFRGRRVLQVLVNTGLRVPPVVLGEALWLLMWPNSVFGPGPLADLRWLYTVNAVILAQTLLVLPIIAALTASAVQTVPPGLLDQARAFGAGRRAVGTLALREARIGVLAALIAALGSAMATVGALLIVGSQSNSATLPSGALIAWTTGGQDGKAAGYGVAMLGLFLVIAASLTLIQQGRRPRWLPTWS